MGKQVFNLKGMTRDMDIAKFSNQYAYEIRNLRLTAQEESTLLAYTTEKGNAQYTVTANLSGKTIVGYCVLNEYLVLFLHGNNDDYILRLKEGNNTSMLADTLYEGNLGFSVSTEIEAIGVYENEDIQKVYWIDGEHQPRVINIVADAATVEKWGEMSICPFDFVLEMELNETVTITKQVNAYGVFTAGTIQYVFCYYMNNGQRSNAFYVSPINYITRSNRGGQPGETLSNAFYLEVAHLDTNWDNLLIYSISRSSEDSTPVCRKVTEMAITGTSATYLDTGLNTEAVDYSEILYLGGGNIVPYTMEQKNNTLFFGNIQDNTFFVETNGEFATALKDCPVQFVYGSEYEETSATYPYKFQLDHDQSEISTFMFGELYKFGMILQNKYGQWSNVLSIGDNIGSGNTKGYFRCELTPSDDDKVKRVIAEVRFTSGAYTALQAITDVKKIKLVRLKDTTEVVAQGVVCPTVFNKQRKGGIYAQSSWFFRPTTESEGNTARYKVYSKHNANIRTRVLNEPTWDYITPRGEIIAGEHLEVSAAVVDSVSPKFNDTDFFVDWNILTIHSPEITYEKISEGSFLPKLIGYTTMDKSMTSAYYTLQNPPHSNITPSNILPAAHSYSDEVWISKGLYEDNLFNTRFYDGQGADIWNTGTVKMPVFTWHRSASLGNQSVKKDNKWYGELATKCLASLRISTSTNYLTNSVDFKDSNPLDVKFYNDDSNIVLFPKDDNNEDFVGEKMYRGEMDTVLNSSGYRLYSQVSTDHLWSEDGYAVDTKCQIGVSNEPVYMRYKSTRHGIMDLGYTSDHKQIIPDIDKINIYTDKSYVFWKQNPSSTVSGPKIKAVIDVCGYTDGTHKDIAQNILIYDRDEIYGTSLPGKYKGNILIRKGLVDLYGDILIGDYITVANSVRVIDENAGTLDGKILKRIEYDIDPEITGGYDASEFYYQFTPVIGFGWGPNTSTFDYEEDMIEEDSNYFKVNNEYVASWRLCTEGSLLHRAYSDSEELTYVAGVAKSETHPYSYAYQIYYWLVPKQTGYFSGDYYSVIQNPIEETQKDYTFLLNLTRSVNHPQNFTNSQWLVTSTEIRIDDLEEISDMSNPGQNQGDRGEGEELLTYYPATANIADAYFQRFDCLKTYPYSDEDPNQIVEIFSFMVQTRINLDGRWDINRGLMDNTLMNPTNFGLLNQGYTQDDNLFSSSYLDSAKFKTNYYPNQIMWTGVKEYGADVDNWTHVIPTSTLDMDGVYGKISSLKLWNDQLLFFQDKAFGTIQYNDRTAIATTTGVPIELANSDKVDGKHYIYNTVGCSNKKSIALTPQAVYFADSNSRELYRFGSQGLESISKSKGFNTYLYNSDVKFNLIRTFYDPKLKDVYFRIHKSTVYEATSIEETQNQESQEQQETRGDTPTPPTPTPTTSSECLVFNEQYNEFMAFLDYDMEYMLALKDSLISIRNNTLWKQFAGNYLTFFGSVKPYSMTLISAENPTIDKTFTNVEFRADVLDDNDKVVIDTTAKRAALPFTKIRAWNEYQDTNDKAFVTALGFTWNTSQKFRIWRANIPRVRAIERIRNPWTKIKLLYDGNDSVKTVIHDIVVNYV